MRLPSSLLSLLSVGSIALAACGADTGYDEEEAASGQTALTSQSADSGSASADAGVTPDSGQEKGPAPVVSPSDPCPPCGMG